MTPTRRPSPRAPRRRARQRPGRSSADHRHGHRQRADQSIGRLVPNTELGHIELNGTDAETRSQRRRTRAAAAALEGMGAGVQPVPGAPRVLPLARPDHPRRRRQQGHDQVPRAPRDQGTDRAGPVPQHRGHHRRGHARCRCRECAVKSARCQAARPVGQAGLTGTTTSCKSTCSTRPTSSFAPISRPARSAWTLTGQPVGATIGVRWRTCSTCCATRRDAPRLRLGPRDRVVAQHALAGLQDRRRSRSGCSSASSRWPRTRCGRSESSSGRWSSGRPTTRWARPPRAGRTTRRSSGW